MRHQRLLDFARGNFLAGDDDQVFLSTRDVEEAVGIKPSEVAGLEPAIGRQRRRGFGGEIVIALHHHRALHPDLVIDDPDLHAGDRLAHAARLVHLRRVQSNREAGFRHAIGFVERDAEARLECLA